MIRLPAEPVGMPLWFGRLATAQPGHEVWKPSPTSTKELVHVPWTGWGGWLRHFDGILAPSPEEPGRGTLIHLHEHQQVTLLAWWDRSGDTRGASNSILLSGGRRSAGQMLETLRTLFPVVWRQQLVPITVFRNAKR